ncbi:MAG: putative Ig domain-containing protein, partial [Deltaproteobacteria bacterium]|nr:putative Ig domain-containing protein [Deltaproteobacteria bacterium]
TLTDVDEGDSHSYTLSGNPVWVSINPDTGELTGTPVEANIGTTEGLIITVTDQGTLSATHTLSITVNDVQHAPQIINTPAASVDTEAVYSFTPEVTDADSTDMHTFSISNQPANWSSFDPATGTLTGTPPGDAGGPYSGVEITVTDNTEMSTTIGPFTILVNDVTAPGSVTQLTAENGESQVALNWVNPVETDFAGVVVRRAVSPATPTGPDDDSADLIDSSGISTTPGGSASMVDSTPINGITYNYAVYAQDGAGNASFSGVLTAGTPVAIPPGDVVDLKVIGGDGQLTLSWANPSDADFAGVTLVRREGADPNGPNDPLAVSVNTSALNTTPDATVILTDTGLANDGPAYHYAAFSYDAIGNYAGGVLISATPSVPPGEVTLLSSKKGFAEVKMDWTNPVDSDFSHVLMLRREGQYPAGAMDPLATVVDTTTANVAPGGAVTGFVDDNGLTNTITYFYKLFTVDTLGSVSTGTAFEETPWWPDYVWTFESGSLGFTCFDGPDSDYTCGWSNTSTKAASGSRSIMSNGLNSFSDQLWGPSVTFSDRSTINFDVWSDIPSAFGGLGIWVWDTVQGKKVKVGGFSDATAGVWQNHTIPLGVMASNTSAQRVDLNLVTNSYANWVYMYLDNIRMSYINPTNTLANYTYNSWWKDASRFGSDGSNTTFSTTEYMQTGKTSTGTYELRSYASFTVTSGAPNRAYQGSLTLTLYSYTSDDPSETVCVYDVHTPLDDMLYIRGTSRLDPAIFDDLGTGVELGCLEVTAADVGTVITIPISGKMLEQDLLPKMSPTASSEYTLGLRLVSVNMGTEGTEMVRFDNNGNVTASEIQFSYTIYSEY